MDRQLRDLYGADPTRIATVAPGVDLVEGAQEHALGVLVRLLAKPRQDDARAGIAFGGHKEASLAAGRSSASSAARMARIA